MKTSPQRILTATLLTLLMLLSPDLTMAFQQSPLTKAEVLARLQAAKRREILQGDVAAEIQERGVSFQLTDSLLDEFRRAGAKSIVIDALLRANTRQSATPAAEEDLPPTPPSQPIDKSRPADIEQELASLPVIEQARYHALSYTQELPNFIVHQRVKRYIREPAGGQWQLRDTLDLEVTYEVNRGEQYKLQSINGQPTRGNYKDVGGASSAGEFGSLLVALFAPKSKAEFQRGPAERINGRAATVYDFHVPTATSSNQITESTSGQTVVSGYRGSVWIDQETKRVLRIEQSADDIPASFPITVAESAVDYSWVEISGKRFLLPQRAELIIGSEQRRLYSRNVIEFSDYRKFEVDVRLSGSEETEDQ
ncbi:MAG: hypothetical protein AB1489_19720 [Acidobacteriota bacterium]